MSLVVLAIHLALSFHCDTHTHIIGRRLFFVDFFLSSSVHEGCLCFFFVFFFLFCFQLLNLFPEAAGNGGSSRIIPFLPGENHVTVSLGLSMTKMYINVDFYLRFGKFRTKQSWECRKKKCFGHGKQSMN